MLSARAQRSRLRIPGVACGLALAGLFVCTAQLWPAEQLEESPARRRVAAPVAAPASMALELQIADRRDIAMAEEDLFDALMPAPESFAQADVANTSAAAPTGSPGTQSTSAAELAAYDAIVAERRAIFAAARTFVRSRERDAGPAFHWRAHRNDRRGGLPPDVLPFIGCSAAGAASGQLREFGPGGVRIGGRSFRLPERGRQVSTYMGMQPGDGSIPAVVRLHFFAFRNGYNRAPAGILIPRRNPVIVPSRLFASAPPPLRLHRLHRALCCSSAHKPRAISSIKLKPRFAQFSDFVHLSGDLL